MKRLLVGSLGCSLAWLSAAVAQEGAPRRLPAQPAAGVALGRPQALSDAPAQPQARAAAPARLSPLITGDAIQLAGFSAPAAVAPAAPAELSTVEMDLAPALPARRSIFAGGDLQPASTTTTVFAMEGVQPPPVLTAPAPVAAAPAAAPTVSAGIGPRLTDWCCAPGDPAAAGVTSFADPGFAYDGGGIVGSKFYVRAEYLLWWLKGPDLPVLVTTSPFASQGILGNPGTVVLYGGRTENFDPFHGGRFTIGWWCDPCNRWGIEASGFALGTQKLKFDASSEQFPLLGRPFFNNNLGVEDAQLTAAQGIANGTVTIRHPTSLWGVETNVLCAPRCGGWFNNCRWFGGVRYLDLGEGLSIIEDVTVVGAVPPPAQIGDRAIVGDIFMTRNQFIGGQVGFDAEWNWGAWSLNIKPKVAVGVNHQTVKIDGFQSVQRGGATLPFVGGLLALPSNIGKQERNRFAVVPEIGVNLGYQINENWRATVGYTFMYWTNVLRPADQIDRVLDINQIPNFRPPAPAAPTRRPVVPFKESGFWAQGMNMGLEYRY